MVCLGARDSRPDPDGNPQMLCREAADSPTSIKDLHIFCNASKRAYRSVAYLRTEDAQKEIYVSFVLARFRVAPKKKLSMPLLELSAALTGAQLASVLQTELTLPIRKIVLWSDSTTVLHWIKSESCHYKVFVGTRVAEIQSLTDVSSWRYVDSLNNPADDITWGKTLKELSRPHRWQRPNINKFSTWKDLMWATARSLHWGPIQALAEAADYMNAENLLLKEAQSDSFPEMVKALVSDQPLPPNSRLGSLSPKYDKETGLHRVGGRLQRAE